MSVASIYIDKAMGVWNHAGFQKYFQNTGWMFLGKIASMAISFIATSYIARNLGPTNYGELSYAVSFVGLFSFLATLGIDNILYIDLVKYPEKKKEYLGTAIILRLLAAILTIIISFIFAFFLSPKDVSLFIIFIISLTFIFNSFQLLNYEFQAETKSKYPALISLSVVLILNILKVLIIFLNKGVIYLAAIILLESILLMIGFIYLRLKIYGNFQGFIFKKEIAKQMLNDSLPLIFASAFFAIYARIDQVMIKNMLNSESVGLYDAAVKLSEIWYFIPNIIITSIFPAIVNIKKVSEELYYKRLKKVFFIVTAISFLTAFFTFLFSKNIILIVFGSGFIGAVTVVNIYVWSNIGAILNFISQQILIIENQGQKISLIVFGGMITNILLNLLLIPKYGISGAAFATLISYFVPFISLLFFKTTRKIIINIFKIC